MKRTLLLFCLAILIGQSAESLHGQEKKPWTPNHICGRLEYVQKIPVCNSPNTLTEKRKSLRFRNERWAKLLIDTLYHYRGTAYLLHEFVIMPDHIHVLIAPLTSLEKAVQFIKGGFSYRAKKKLAANMEVWQKGFSDHRIRDANDYAIHVSYIRQNPVKERFCTTAKEFPYSSAHVGFELDDVPQGLKPESLGEPVTARREGVPFRSKISNEPAAPESIDVKSKTA